MDKASVAKVYGLWAPVYDMVFGAIFEHGRKAVAAAGKRVGGRILEVGVGTGISLPYYSSANRVFGIDISEGMLEKARQRVAEMNLRNVEALEVMDAERLDIPDGSFDVVVAVCVLNTAPNPEAVLSELARVLKPGGEIVLLSRVGAERGARRVFERLFQPVASKLGWRSDFPWERFDRWVSQSPHSIHLIERRPMPPFGHFSMLRFGKATPNDVLEWCAMPSGEGLLEETNSNHQRG